MPLQKSFNDILKCRESLFKLVFVTLTQIEAATKADASGQDEEILKLQDGCPREEFKPFDEILELFKDSMAGGEAACIKVTEIINANQNKSEHLQAMLTYTAEWQNDVLTGLTDFTDFVGKVTRYRALALVRAKVKFWVHERTENGLSLPIENACDLITFAELQTFAHNLESAVDEDMIKLVKKKVQEHHQVIMALKTSTQQSCKQATANWKEYDKRKTHAAQKEILVRAREQAKADEKRSKLQKHQHALQAAREQTETKSDGAVGIFSLTEKVVDFAKFENEDAFLKERAKQSSGKPYVIVKAKSVENWMEKREIAAAHTVFRLQYPNESKSTGRSYRALAIDPKKDGREALAQLAPAQVMAVPPDERQSTLGKQMEQLGQFALTPVASGVVMERQGLGCLRYQAMGEREVVATPASAIMEWASKIGATKASDEKFIDFLTRCFTTITPTTDITEFGDQFYKTVLPAGSVVFMPTGWIMAERVIGTKNVDGIRMPIIDCDPENIQKFKLLVQGYHATIQGVNALDVFWKKLTDVMQKEVTTEAAVGAGSSG